MVTPARYLKGGGIFQRIKNSHDVRITLLSHDIALSAAEVVSDGDCAASLAAKWAAS